MQTYFDPKRESEPHALPDCEVFYIGINEAPEFTEGLISQGHWPDEAYEQDYAAYIGWYWWACFPGCLPDGEACGPFKTAAEAESDAQNID